MANNITKAELLTEVSRISGVSKVDAEEVLRVFFETATARAYGGDQVSWPGFGSFKSTTTAARMGRNPQTGEAIPVQAHKKMKFTQSSTLKETLNAAKAPPAPKAAKKRPAAKKAAKNTAKKSAKKSTKKSARKSAKKSARKSAKKSARGRKR